MKKIFIFIWVITVLFAGEYSNIMIKTDSGFIMKPIGPRPCKQELVKETPTGFLFNGRIIWGEPIVGNNKVGDPYKNGLVFVSEKKTRAWEYVGKTDENGTFSLPIKSYEGFQLYAWDGSSKTLTMYDGHFYYNSELHNLYQTPTGDEPKIADKSDVTVERINDE